MKQNFENDFERLLYAIKHIRKEIKGMTFEQAFEYLGGHNKDETLFDYYIEIDGYDGYMIGTIENKNGKAFMDKDSTFYEVWSTDDDCFDTQTLAMTENEIREQVDRLK